MVHVKNHIKVVNRSGKLVSVTTTYSPLTGRLNIHTNPESEYMRSPDGYSAGWRILSPKETVDVPIRFLDRPGGMFPSFQPELAPLRVKEHDFVSVKRISKNKIALVPKGEGIREG